MEITCTIRQVWEHDMDSELARLLTFSPTTYVIEGELPGTIGSLEVCLHSECELLIWFQALTSQLATEAPRSLCIGLFVLAGFFKSGPTSHRFNSTWWVACFLNQGSELTHILKHNINALTYKQIKP